MGSGGREGGWVLYREEMSSRFEKRQTVWNWLPCLDISVSDLQLKQKG